MKEIISSLILISAVSCAQQQQPGQIDASNDAINIEVNCNNSVLYGDVDICLPIIDGMTECYSLPAIKARADEFNHVENSILAFYLSNEIYEKLDKIGELVFDDYFQLYAVDRMKEMKVGQRELDKYGSMMEGNYIKENWNDLKTIVEKKHEYLSFGRPVLIDSYSPHSNVRTFIMISKLQVLNDEIVTLMALNLLQIKDRLIWLSYYNHYKGEESIKLIKAKNDYIVLQIMDENTIK